MQYWYDRTIDINGEKIFLSKEIINELHRQENIQLGKNVVELRKDEISIPLEEITDEQYLEIADTIEFKNMSESGDYERRAIAKVLNKYGS